MLIYSNPDHYSPTFSAAALLSTHFGVHVFCRNMEPPLYEWPKDILVHRLGNYSSAQTREAASPLSKLIEYLGFLQGIRKAARSLRPRIIYAFDFPALAAAFLAGNGLPHATVFHCYEQPDRKTLRRLSLEAWLVKYAMARVRSAVLVVYPEKYRAEYYMQWSRDDRLPMIVPNCPSLKLIAPPRDLGSQIEYRWRRREILYTGTIGPGYGLLESVEALAGLDNAFAFKMFGFVRDRVFATKLLEKARNLRRGDRVSIREWLPHDQFVAETSCGSLGLALYQPVGINRECVGPASMKLFEYAARGMPIVAPHTKSFVEFFSNESWVMYADPSDPISLRRTIAEIFRDQARYVAMCREARRAFEQRYNYEHVFAPVMLRLMELSRFGVEQA
jgi:glycosyltransferase involved in cell wall biosynthesis